MSGEVRGEVRLVHSTAYHRQRLRRLRDAAARDLAEARAGPGAPPPLRVAFAALVLLSVTVLAVAAVLDRLLLP